MIEIFIWFLGTLLLATGAAFLAKHYGVEYLIATFTTAVVVANVVASKIVTIGPLAVSAGVVAYSITFLLTDTISEFWGKKEAQKAIWAGFLGLVMMVLVTQLSLRLTPSDYWLGQEAFAAVFGNTLRIALASFIAYVIAQHHDVWAYHFWMGKTGRKHLWIRNNASTWISQVIDTIIFTTIAFYGVFPIGPIIAGEIILKIIIAAFDTPFFYLIRWYYEKRSPRWSF
ncbi:MAG: queuosine precursor transporter [Anaplasmataceae bacterium]|nr:queuosine precursor transporter [Anaplasmataceae bacterium]